MNQRLTHVVVVLVMTFGCGSPVTGSDAGGGSVGGGSVGGGSVGGGSVGGGSVGGGSVGGGSVGGGSVGGGSVGGGSVGGGSVGGGSVGGGSPAADGGFSLRFFGTQRNDLDRVKVRADQGPVNVNGDFTLELWLKATAAENPLDACGTGGAGWINGNIFADRDIYGAGDFGDYGLSLNGGRVAFGVEVLTSGATLCGVTSITDGGWHHVAVTRRASDGRQQLFLDGRLDRTVTGATGDLSYRTGRSTAWPASDPFLVFGAEKHDAVPPGTGYSGWMDEVRLSRVVRYDAGFPRPTTPFNPDPDTVLLLHFDEGQGLSAFDSSASAQHGTLKDGGTPEGPRWTRDTPF